MSNDAIRKWNILRYETAKHDTPRERKRREAAGLLPLIINTYWMKSGRPDPKMYIQSPTDKHEYTLHPKHYNTKLDPSVVRWYYKATY